MCIRDRGPSLQHPCGTDQMGRDLFIRILYGARISLSIGLAAAAINFVIGVVYGGLSGYIGGRADMVMMRIVDILSSLPSLLYIVLIMLLLGSNVGSVILALCLTSWVGTARVVRSEVMRLKHSEYVLSRIHIWRDEDQGRHQARRGRRRLFPVSYTHLDVYKRQLYSWSARTLP